MLNGVTLIGTVSRDIVRLPGRPERRQPGGAVYYAGLALRALGVRVNIITRLAEQDRAELLTPLHHAGATITALSSRDTTCFINSYSLSTDERKQQVTSCSDPFLPADGQSLFTQWVYLAPLLASDIPAELIREIAKPGKHAIALDAQGLLRMVADANVLACGWPNAHEILPHIDILKADAEEAELITGQSNPEMAARILCGRGADHALVTQGNTGAVICHRGALIRQPASRPAGDWPIIDPTGCGDTFLAAYLACIIKGHQAAYAGRFAAAAAAQKLKAFGALSADWQAIRRLALAALRNGG